MIKLNYMFEKNAIHLEKEKFVGLIRVIGEKESKKTKKRKINLSLCIDTSSSMSSALKYNKVLKVRNIPNFPNMLNNVYGKIENVEKNLGYIEQPFYEYIPSISKIEQAKNAAIEAIEMLKVGDFISIVCFDSSIKILLEATKISNTNKKEIINKIKSIQASGSTNLHDGWLSSATEVSKNIDENYINRVIILSDGETNIGIVDPKVIEENVNKLYNKSITTTCIGLGENFNEKLLESLSISGGGNFYYVEKESELESFFKEEFKGLSNLVASEVNFEYEAKNAKIFKQLNALNLKDNKYIVNNILNNKPFDILIEFEIDKVKKTKLLELGQFKLNYKDEDGNLVTKTIELNIPVVSKEEYNEMPNNQEVKVQETLMVVANQKFDIANAISRGNMDEAKSLMAHTSSYIASSGVNDNRLTTESMSLNNIASSNMSNETMKKTMLYDSYKTRNNK